MNYFKVLILLAIAGGSGKVRAQEGRILKDTGLLKLSVFLGTWEAHNAPDSKDTTRAVYGCRWSDNGHFLVCDQVIFQGGSPTNNLAIYSFDGLKDAYTLSVVGIPGNGPFSMPVRSRQDTLFYLGQYNDRGKVIYTRTLNIFKSDTRYRFVVQSSDDSLHWKTSLEGTAVKSIPGSKKQ